MRILVDGPEDSSDRAYRILLRRSAAVNPRSSEPSKDSLNCRTACTFSQFHDGLPQVENLKEFLGER